MHERRSITLPGGRMLDIGRDPLLMGILNITPDSFSDGGRHHGLANALAHANTMLAEGAQVIDVGGESTRPGAGEVGVQEELDRVIPVLEQLVPNCPAAVSIDTYKAVVADQAIQSGAGLINDVYGLQREPEIADVAGLYDVPVVAMHWDKARDRERPLVDEMRRYFDRTFEIAERAGLARERIILDPGFGFGKTLAENYQLLRTLDQFLAYGCPLLVGTSRKSMIGKVLGNEADERLAGTIATNVLAYGQGAQLFRVHDVRPNRDALRIAAAALYGPPQTAE